MAVASWFKMKARHYEVFAAASDEQAGKAIKAALAYLNAGELSQLEGVEAILFGVLKPDIDDSITAYQKRCETNRENGKLGGRPRCRRSQSDSRWQSGGGITGSWRQTVKK